MFEDGLLAARRVLPDGEAKLTFAGIGMYRAGLFADWRGIVGDVSGVDDTPPRFKLAPLLRAAMLRALPRISEALASKRRCRSSMVAPSSPVTLCLSRSSSVWIGAIQVVVMLSRSEETESRTLRRAL